MGKPKVLQSLASRVLAGADHLSLGAAGPPRFSGAAQDVHQYSVGLRILRSLCLAAKPLPAPPTVGQSGEPWARRSLDLFPTLARLLLPRPLRAKCKQIVGIQELISDQSTRQVIIGVLLVLGQDAKIQEVDYAVC